MFVLWLEFLAALTAALLIITSGLAYFAGYLVFEKAIVAILAGIGLLLVRSVRFELPTSSSGAIPREQ